MGIKHNVFQVHLCCNTYHYFIPLCGWIKFSIIFSRSEGSWTWVFQRASAIVQGKVNVSQFSCSVMSDSLQPHGLQHTRLLCPSPTPTQTHVHWVSDAPQPSHPLSSPFSSCLQSFPASGSFPMSQLFTSRGQSIDISASALVLSKNI